MTLAINTTHALQSSSAGFGIGAYTTGPITTVNDSLLLVLVTAMGTNVPPGNIGNSITLSISTGETVTPRLRSPASSNWLMGHAWFTIPITTGASATLTVDCGSFDIHSYRVKAWSLTGANTSSPVGGTANPASIASPTGAKSITLSAPPAASSIIFAALQASMNGDTGAATPGAGWTEVDDVTISDWETVETQRITGLTSTTVPWADVDAGSGTYFDLLLSAIEIKQASAGGGSSNAPRAMYQYRQRRAA